MRWLALLLLVACAAHPRERISPPAPGALALVETATDLDGAPVGSSLARATIVVVLASWCEHCAAELAILDRLHRTHPALRVVGVSYAAHEEFDHRGNPAALRIYAAKRPWLPIVTADDGLFAALGAPPQIPALFVFDHGGALAAHYDRRSGPMPNGDELTNVLARLGA